MWKINNSRELKKLKYKKIDSGMDIIKKIYIRYFLYIDKITDINKSHNENIKYKEVAICLKLVIKLYIQIKVLE